jgi:hypothetical protein
MQFKKVHKGKQYHWVNNSKRKHVRNFFLQAYRVPPDFYEKHESTFFKLIMNTVKDVTMFGIQQRPDVDNAIDGVFRQNPSRQNIKVFFTNEAIIGLWRNKWGGKLTAYVDSKFMKKVLSSVHENEINKFVKQIRKLGIDEGDILSGQ